MSLSPDRLAGLDAFLIRLNHAAGEVILPLFRNDHGLEDKNAGGSIDPVTEADKGAERAIRALISKHYPDHGVIGEEYGEDRPDAEFVWVLDPIDGTRAFIAGLPLWTTLIALRCQGEPVLSSIGQSYIGEIFIGSQAAGSRLITRGGETQLKTRPCARLADAIIATTDPEACFKQDEHAAWTAIRSQARLARLGCDAYAFAMDAAGKLDLVVEGDGLKSWDIDAAVPLIEGAGGIAANWRGDRVGRDGGQLVLSGDKACLDEALPALRLAAR
jgi:histidinol phosphatase-like enzyme (inositol monophosphatase family)